MSNSASARKPRQLIRKLQAAERERAGSADQVGHASVTLIRSLNSVNFFLLPSNFYLYGLDNTN